MAEIAWEALQTVGAPRWDETAKAIAREIQVNAGVEAMDEPFIDECEKLISPQEAEAILRRDLPPSQINSTSDDYTDMTWHAPTARFYVARPALKAPEGLRLSELGDERAWRHSGDDRSDGASALRRLLRWRPCACLRTKARAKRQRTNSSNAPAAALAARTGSRRFATTNRRSISAGRNMSPLRAGATGGYPTGAQSGDSPMTRHEQHFAAEPFTLQRRNPNGGTKPLDRLGLSPTKPIR